MERHPAVHQKAQHPHREKVLLADGSRVGVRLPRGGQEGALLQRQGRGQQVRNSLQKFKDQTRCQLCSKLIWPLRHERERRGVDVFSLYCKLRWQRTKVCGFCRLLLPSWGFVRLGTVVRAFRLPVQPRAGLPGRLRRISSCPGQLTLYPLPFFPFPKTPAWAKGASAARRRLQE